MKIIVVGGTGTIGEAVIKELAPRHTVISVGHSSGDYQCDITDKKAIEKMYQQIGKVDAVISTTGKVHSARLAEMTDDLYQIGLKNKLLGQVNLVLLGIPFVNDGGSFTLTSGILSHEPLLGTTNSAMVNGALDAFVKCAAIDLPRQLRINIVSPTVLTESMDIYATRFRGYEPVPAAIAALAYSRSVEGAQTGQVYRVGY